MKATQFLFVGLFILLFFTSCQKKYQAKELATGIDSLHSIQRQAEYLIKLKDRDQETRTASTKALKKFGFGSKQYKDAEDKMNLADEENLYCIEYYLKRYGYPSSKTHGKEACEAPWLIIHHSSDGLKPRVQNFKYVYRAWKNTDIDGTALTFYLNRMCQLKYGKRIDWAEPYYESEEIDTLVNSLNLREIREEIDSDVRN